MDKKITFEFSGRGFDVQKRQLDSFVKGLESLKKQGLEVNKVFKGLDSTSSLINFNKTLITTSRSLKGLGKDVTDFFKGFTDQRVKSSQEQLKGRLESINSSIKRYVEYLKSTNIETEKRARLEERVLTLAAKSTTMQHNLLELQAQGGGFKGMMAKAAGYLPTSEAGMMALGGAAFGAGVAGVRTFAGMRSEYWTGQQEALAAKAGVVTPRVIEALQGQAGRERYFRQIGGNAAAEKYMSDTGTWELIRRGRFGAAMGLSNKLGGTAADVAGTVASGGLVAGGLAGLLGIGTGLGLAIPTGGASLIMAGAGMAALGTAAYVGVRGALGERPQDIREKVKTQQYLQGRQFSEQQKALDMYYYEYAADRAGGWNQMQRLLGTGIYGAEETGRRGVVGNAVRMGFTRNDADRMAIEMAERGGARGVGGTNLGAALTLQREYGLERAGAMMGGLGTVGGFGRQESILKDTLAMAVSKGLQNVDMKIEREAYVEAVMAATERLTGRYGGATDLQNIARNIAVTGASMLSSTPTLQETQRLPGAIEGANAVLSGQTSQYMRARVMAPMMRFMAGGATRTSPVSFITAQKLANMPMDEITAENLYVQGTANTYYGSENVSPKQLSDYVKGIRAARESGAGGAADFLRGRDRARAIGLAKEIRGLSPMSGTALDASGQVIRGRGLSATESSNWRIRKGHELATLLGTSNLPGDELQQAMEAAKVSSVAFGLPGVTKAEEERFRKGAGGAWQNTGTAAIAQQKAVAAGDDVTTREVEKRWSGIKEAMVGAATSAKTLSDSLGDLNSAGRFAKSFADNLQYLSNALEKGDFVVGRITGKPSYAETAMNTPSQVSTGGEKGSRPNVPRSR